MNKLIFFLLLLIGLSVKAQGLTYEPLGNVMPSDIWITKEIQETIHRVEVKKDTLYVYLKTLPNTNFNGQISVDNVRDVYTIVNGEMTKIRREHPTYKEVKKTIIELKEVWQ